MSNFQLRALTGAVYVLTVVGSIWLHPLALYFFLMVVCAFGLWEFYRLATHATQERFSYTQVVLGVFIYALIAAVVSGYAPVNSLGWLLLLIIVVPETALYTKPPVGFTYVGTLFQSWIYIPLSLALLQGTGFVVNDTFQFWIPMGIFILIWLNDTGAYLVGRRIGKTPLAKTISPNKTIEGTVGGALLAMAASVGLAEVSGLLNLGHWLVLGALVAITGTSGDLIESRLKRQAGVKDSGNSLPGHGGFLDRFDSVFIAAPAVYIYLTQVV